MAKFKVGIYGMLNNAEHAMEADIFKGADIEIVNPAWKDEAAFLKTLPEIDGLIVLTTEMTREMIMQMNKCKVIVRQGLGVDNLDLKAMQEKSMQAYNVPDYCVDEVTTHAMTLALMLVRDMTYYMSDIAGGVWNALLAPMSRRASELTFGLAGFGRMSQIVAAKAKPFFKEIVAYDPYMNKDAAAKLGVKVIDTLDEILKISDVLSLHIPLMESTQHMMNEEKLKLMKPSAYLVNTARGGLIDGAALYKALKEGWIKGAGLDVMEEEPPSFDDPLFTLKNVIITPHSAWRSDAAGRDIRAFAAKTMRTALLEGSAPNRVI
ncbi:MAG: C-terminal binding protein [Candidatus Adiutrix sp.]|jgi:phosphoglycerate dehydrogenase-like enzyme|nr:C-terminal binding protein [Candidatus Adiutrix sp.]